MDREIEEVCRAAARVYCEATLPLALTGAGISVDCGIPDFRSRGGLWSVFDPEEYATLSVFLENPEKAWDMFRALGTTIHGKTPGPAHYALASLERHFGLEGVITQNIDGLHSAAGSSNIVEIHGDCRSLQCLHCGGQEPAGDSYLKEGPVPLCSQCGSPLKPNVVLFEEAVRGMSTIENLLVNCDLLIVIGTSVTVYPVAGIPYRVLSQGGHIIEFNREQTPLTSSCDFHCEGRVDVTVPQFVSAVQKVSSA